MAGLSMAAKLLACRLCRHARPHCEECCNTCQDGCNGRQLCYYDLPEKELVNRAHKLRDEEESVKGIGKLKLTDVPVSAAEKKDPALHMEMETLRGERELQLQGEAKQTDKERRIAECHQFIGRIQAANMFAKTGNVSELMWIKDVKDAELYKDLPGIETWEKFCQSIGYTAHHINDQIKNLDTLGAELLETVSGLRVSFRDIKKLRQLTNEGLVQLENNTLIIEDETIPIDADHADEIHAAIEKILESKKSVEARNEKLEKDFKGAVKEETKGLTLEKKALLKEVERLKAFDPEEQDREWSVEQMAAIEQMAGEFVVMVQKFIIDPRFQDDRHLQARVSGHLQEAEMALHDQRLRLDDIINMFND